MYCLCRFCCSVYCLYVDVYCTNATGCQPNCSKQIYITYTATLYRVYECMAFYLRSHPWRGGWVPAKHCLYVCWKTVLFADWLCGIHDNGHIDTELTGKRETCDMVEPWVKRVQFRRRSRKCRRIICRQLWAWVYCRLTVWWGFQERRALWFIK